MSFKSQKEIYEALLAGKVLMYKTGLLVKLGKDGRSLNKYPDDKNWKEDSWSFVNTSDWSTYKEPNEPRKMVAFISNDGSGRVVFGLENSDLHLDLEKCGLYTRAEGFDMIEKLDEQ